ncbi:MAG: hypothetical protein COA96_18080 [SAR86 cluster bacterium]|uniref:DUF4156 domain-containing protein n=1 Tax=SAR86 cluster bacterium TaxID=2030880 RepID=A0A2A5ACH2_9GAMM|nr:MAG: hypothetical protein COA96_18080 [SAR86 cluster bacterium]
MKTFLTLSILLASLTGCASWVQVTSAGQSVRVVATASEIPNCRRIGQARAQTLGKIILVERGAQRLQEELQSLARNEAGDMGGNFIVPETLISNGQQTFGVYSCP